MIESWAARVPWAGQLLRFGSVGAAATLVHVLLYMLLVGVGGLSPVFSNLVAFSIAVVVSFSGHANWTFRNEYRTRSSRSHVLFTRFVISAVLGLLLNTVFVYVLVTTLGLDYVWAIPCFVLLTPLLLYLLNRLWVFGE